MSSSASEAPFEVAKLCSNCQKIQFRDDIPQLRQSGPYLELDREQLPEDRRTFLKFGGFLPTEFALTDSYPDLPRLRRSSQDGCDFCRFLHEIVVSFTSQDLHINKITGCIMSISISYTWAMLYVDGVHNWKKSRKSGESPSGLDAMAITAEFSSDEIGDGGFTLPLVCHVESACDSDAVSLWLRLRNRSNQDYCDADSIQWMKQTLETCVESHGHSVFDHEYIPERLIDVRPETPRLALREDLTPLKCASAPKYAALSYCWGSGENQARTTVATLSDRQAGITETELPLAIRDAIKATRALDIPYLWVDALCILQDDPSDWERQCTEMHNIYGSAQVTLCAANSRSCDQGFLRQTGQIIRIPFQSQRKPNPTGSFLLQYKGLVEKSNQGLIRGFLGSDTYSSHWDGRGWVFQEKILSTRALVFGARDLHFFCKAGYRRRGQVEVPANYNTNVAKSSIEKDPEAMYGTWDDIVHRYSAYKTDSFTNATDILPALSGLARLFHGRLKDDYYAGHWRRDLYQSLLWCGDGLHTHHEPFWSDSFSRQGPETFIVPSWSRLNKGETLSHTHISPTFGSWSYEHRSNVELLSAEVLMDGHNLFGALTGCSLRLRGYTLDMSLREVHVSEHLSRRHIVPHSHSLSVNGHDFGILSFDCKSRLDDKGGKCVSECDFGQFKLLLLMNCDYYVPEETPTHSSSGGKCSGEGEYRNEGIPDQQQMDCGRLDSKGNEWEDSSKQEQMSSEEASAPNDGNSEDTHNQQDSSLGSSAKIALRKGNFIRKGLGLILCPTENDGEFSRVGVFSPADQPGGDIRELRSLARVETVQLV